MNILVMIDFSKELALNAIYQNGFFLNDACRSGNFMKEKRNGLKNLMKSYIFLTYIFLPRARK